METLSTPIAFHSMLVFYRNRLGMQQVVLAQRVGLDKTLLNKIEKGIRPVPALEKVLSIAEELRLTLEEIKDFLQIAGYSSALEQSHPAVKRVRDGLRRRKLGEVLEQVRFLERTIEELLRDEE